VALASIFLLSPLGPQRSTARTGIAASLFGANIELARVPGGGYFDLDIQANAMLHTWSLSVEEQFYLVFPAFLALSWYLASRLAPRRPTRSVTAVFVLLGSGVSFALSMLLTYHPSYRLGTNFAFYSAASRAWEFGAGVLLAFTLPLLTRVAPRVGMALGVVGLVLVGIGAFTLSDVSQFPGAAALLPVVGAALLIVGGTASAGGLTRVFVSRPLVWLGDVSYGWYLWHWPLIVFTAAMWPGRPWALVVAAAFALVPTSLSYRFLENPLRFNDRIVGRRVVALVAVCIAVPIACCLVLLAVGRAELRSSAIHRFDQAMAFHADRQRGCDVPESLAEGRDPACTWKVPAAKGHVYLVGDSNAGQFTEPVAAAANRRGFDFTVATSAGCPFVDQIRRPPTGVAPLFSGERCNRAVMDTVDELVKQHPKLVVIASSASEYVNRSDDFEDPRTGVVASTPAAKAAAWQRGLSPILRKLGDHGIPTLVVHTIPQLATRLGDDWRAQTCSVVRIETNSCGGSERRASIAKEQAPTKDAERRAVAGAPLSSSVDLADQICSATTCATRRDGRWVYRDSTHLSIPESRRLTGRFEQLIEQRAR